MSDFPSGDVLQRSLEVSKVFTPTAPVDVKALFAGRHEQLRQVIDAVNQKGQHAIIFGERGVGKTSLANVLAEFLPYAGGRPAITPRINCDSSDTFESVFEKVFREISLVQQTGQGIGFNPAVSVPQQIDGRSLVDGKFTPDNVRRGLSIVSRFYIPIIILDEFDRLSDAVKHSVADTVKTLSDHGVDATIIMVGVADTVAELIKEHASVERAMVQVPMPRMSESEITEVITNGTQQLRLTITGTAQKAIRVLSQGLPHYTHLICLYSARKTIESGQTEIGIEAVEKAIEQAVRNAQQSILSAYHLATMSPRKDNLFSDVLLACALAPVDQMGYFAAQDIRKPIQDITGKDYQIPSFSQHLNEFSEEKRGPILKKIGTARRFRFRFINPLLQPFVVMQGCLAGKVTIS
ncbi:Cdc6-like AAA superfamily ATPase [Paraburkholderia sp. HC6.4b]|uniref:ATP-binding protein n=1 Tax=unclassified Paraburkholderia TaxID=2615204 RepID=UPI00160D4A4D|nr:MULTISPECIES: ATP-binding protein [unclassified Paraburkholderia]MBB5411975.1 Cdc6-like AAA superfamily ATPase [Paraburkholderia sp. HC6.4b]MBB5454042.1 Cdc6-like AAA superfamily ATPase [Paraburkholderia sp. Kb1A]